jgi:hypothetical protein
MHRWNQERLDRRFEADRQTAADDAVSGSSQCHA